MPLQTLAALSDFLTVHSTLAYAVIFAGSFFETLIGIGFFVYGEIFFLTGAALAGAGVLNIWIVAVAAISGSILGDTASYWIGRRFGLHLFSENGFILNYKNLRLGEKFVDRWGARAAFIARLLGPLSWITPFILGVYKIPYRKFIAYNIMGICLGVGYFLVIGYVFGASYQRVLSLERKYLWVLVAIVVLAGVLFHIFKTHIFDLASRISKWWNAGTKLGDRRESNPN